MTTELDIKQLKAFSPLSGLKRNPLYQVLRKAKLVQAQRGKILFKKGDPEERTFFLLSGTVELRKGGEVVETIAAGSDAARDPISPLLPREHTAVAAGIVEVVQKPFDIDTVLETAARVLGAKPGRILEEEADGADTPL